MHLLFLPKDTDQKAKKSIHFSASIAAMLIMSLIRNRMTSFSAQLSIHQYKILNHKNKKANDKIFCEYLSVILNFVENGWMELLLLSSKAQLPATHPVQLHKRA